MEKTEEIVCKEVMDYINAPKHNKPCMLQSIKKDLRTPAVIELIFSRPDIFKLGIEAQYVPKENMNKEIAKRMVFSYPKLLCKKDKKGKFIIPEEFQNYEVFLAFYFSRAIIQQRQRDFSYASCDDIYDNENSIKYRDELLLDLIELITFISNKTQKDYWMVKLKDSYEYLNQYIKNKNANNYVDGNYEKKYDTVTIEHNKPLLIVVEEKFPVFCKHLANLISNSYFEKDYYFLQYIEDSFFEKEKIVITYDSGGLFDSSDYNDDNMFVITIKQFNGNFGKNEIIIPINYENYIDEVSDRVIDEIIRKLSLEPEQGDNSKKFVRKTKKDQ